MTRIITVSREYGSGGGPIAARLAERLGWRLVDDPLVQEIARSANVPPEVARKFDECVDPWFHRLVKAIARGGFEAALPPSEGEPFDAERMAALWTGVIQHAAEIGECVIVGRGGQCILRGHPEAFHVQIFASAGLRLAQLRERFPEVRDPAGAIVQTDARRAAYVRRHFNHDWTDRKLYHLVVNAGIGFDRAVEAVLCAAGLSPAPRPE